MRIRNLDTFYWIASLGSFRAAADKLHLTQPAISARIQVLEQDLGAEVFVRDVRNAELTSKGRLLFDFAERQMVLEQDVLAAFSDTSPIEQTIRVGASETIVCTWLPDFMSHYNHAGNRLTFDLRVDSTDNLRNALVSREIDLAFLMGPVAEVSVTNQDICGYEMIFAAPPRIAENRAKWSADDLLAQSILTFASNTKPNRLVRELLVRSSSKSPTMTTSTSLGAVIRLAKSGIGICAVPKAVIKPELASGELIELKTDLKLPTISFTASYVSASPASRLIQGISDSVATFLKPNMIKNIYKN